MILDLGCIAVVLAINRRTIKLRKLLKDEEAKKADEKVKREIEAARSLIRTQSGAFDEDCQSIERYSNTSSVLRLNQMND